MGVVVLFIVAIAMLFIALANKKPERKTSSDVEQKMNTIEDLPLHEYSEWDLPSDYTVIDTETTGLNPDDRIIELAAVKVRNGAIVSSFNELINPLRPINPIASRVNGITDSMVAGCPSFPDVRDEFLSFIGDDVLVGHNVTFDLGFLNRELPEALENRYIDTLKIARLYVKDSDNHKLSTLVKYFEIEQEQEHRALCDAELTFQVYERLKALDMESKKKEEARYKDLASVVSFIQNSDEILSRYDKAIVDYLKKNIRYKKDIPEQVPELQTELMGSIWFLYRKHTIDEDQHNRLISIAERVQNELNKRIAFVDRIDAKNRDIREPKTDWQRRQKDAVWEEGIQKKVESRA